MINIRSIIHLIVWLITNHQGDIIWSGEVNLILKLKNYMRPWREAWPYRNK